MAILSQDRQAGAMERIADALEALLEHAKTDGESAKQRIWDALKDHAAKLEALVEKSKPDTRAKPTPAPAPAPETPKFEPAPDARTKQ